MNIKKFFFINFLVVSATTSPSMMLDSAKTFFVSGRDEREEQLNHLKNDFATLQSAFQDQFKIVQKHIDQINRDILDVKAVLKIPDQKNVEFLNKKLSILNEIHQALFNIQFLIKEIISTVDQHIKILEDYKKDQGFHSLLLEPRSYYTFESVKNANRKVLYQEDSLNQIIAQKNDALVELDNRKKKLSSALKDYQDKKKAQEEFISKNISFKQDGQEDLTFQERGQLIDLEGKLANYENQLAGLRVQEINKRISLINTKFFLEQEKVKILRENLDHVKSGLRVSELDVQHAREKLSKRKQESLAMRDKRYDEIKLLSSQRDKLKKELDFLAKRYSIPSGRDSTSWSTDLKSIESYSVVCEIGYKKQQIYLLDRKIDLLRAQIDLEEVNFNREEINETILNVWYKIKQRKFKSNTEILAEIKRFKELQEEATRESILFQDKRNASTALLALQNKELANLRDFVQEIEAEKEGLFKKYPTRYALVIGRLHDSEKIITEQIENNSRLIETYSTLIATLDETIKELSFILAELETKSIWQRSEYAISWLGLKNIIPDIIYFIIDLKQLGSHFFMHFDQTAIAKSFMVGIKNGGIIFLYFCIVIIFIILYLFLRIVILPFLQNYFLSVKANSRIIYLSSKILAAIIMFLQKHSLSLFIWLTLFMAIYLEMLTELFPKIMFYLISIVYFLYLSGDFLHFFVKFNEDHNFIILSKSFERRFSIVFSLFAYLTVIIIFFREAFILTTLHKSELPTILLAMYSIFLRTLIIFSIGKEEVLSLVSHRGSFWSWAAQYIDDYYYILLISIIGIMIVSDPYVGGYGNLVSYIMWGTIGTLLLLKIFLALHLYLKRISVALFFDNDDEVMRERFAYAKTSYGIFVITLFVLFTLVGIFIASKIWRIPISISDTLYFLNFPLFDTGFDKTTGQVIWFTPLKFLLILAFIFGGFLLAILFNRYVLRFIFDLLPVDLGVQNTVVSISRYFIIVIAIYLGFQWAGLGTLLLAIGVVIGSIGYIVKEPIGDFISYFIILVQRPIQIGDYIMLDEENQGVVRKITPRSVILRRKDSYSIILPNSMILNKPINNWNYARNFVAFDDIEFTVSFDADPLRIKAIILEVLDKNVDVLKSPRAIIRLHDFSETGFVFKVRGFLSDINIARKWDIASDVRFAIVKTLREAGLNIAIPTRIILNKD